ncbi:unnamed protein product [marine sediment metagenome]|uniref:Uncharacterized protein n=1 Tax=marine sediment metagenome TaxID=412755 RepID=X0U516_9ZZZZ
MKNNLTEHKTKEIKELEKIYFDILKEEGITKEGLGFVDLEIGYSPVIPIRGGRPMEVIKLQGGAYRVPDCPMVGLNISPERLTIMRYRYLINR